ncbi:MAG TPA: TetR/AcrR family transcriptional regulator [Terriglobales bacterium]|nr:TetR/AcrR family transcriptional regulator [Terriglobales bacterium]
MGMPRCKKAPRIGRPRSFDLDKALERAQQVFWRKGYEGTSLPDLTKAMRSNRPSLYAAFGDKEALLANALFLFPCFGCASLDSIDVCQPNNSDPWRRSPSTNLPH